MKKRIFTFAVCGMLLCACLFTLSSCFGKADLPKSGEELWERTNSEMNKVDSYETGITMDVTYYYPHKMPWGDRGRALCPGFISEAA